MGKMWPPFLDSDLLYRAALYGRFNCNYYLNKYSQPSGWGDFSQSVAALFTPFWFPTPKNVMIWLSYMMALSVPDEGYTRHVSCALILYLRFHCYTLRMFAY